MKKILLITMLALFGLSNNANAQWVQAPGLGGAYGAVSSIASDGTNIFAGTTQAFGNGGAGIFLSTNNGSSWTAVNTGLSNMNVSSLAINGTNIFAGTNGGGIFLSSNNGGSWTSVNNGLPANSYVSSIAISGANIVAAANGTVFLSSDNGNNWADISTGSIGAPVISLAINGSNIFAGASGTSVYVSTNNGSNWTQKNLYVNPGGNSNPRILSLAISGTTIYAGNGGSMAQGIYSSADGGVTWAPTGKTTHTIYSLAISGTNVFAGTNGGGVFVSSDNGVSWANTGLTSGNIYALTTIGTNLFAGTDKFSSLVWKRPLSEMLTGIEDLIIHQDIGVYPNPSTGKFTIDLQNKHNEISFDVFNLIGEKVLQQENSNEIDLSTSPKGIYFVKIYDGENSTTKKIVVE